MTQLREAPWTWTLKDTIGALNDKQRRYVEFLPRVFNLRTAGGKVVPYRMEPYQAWWHAHSRLAMGKDAPSRIVEKGRGLGLTLMAAMDALMLAHRDEAITIPVAGRAGDTSDEFIEKTWHLIDDCQETELFDPRRDVRARVELLHSGNPSRIVPMPGGSPEKVRSKRTIHAVLDEFAFHEYAERLWRAVRGSQSEGGTLDVLSTHNGADTLYYRLLEDAKAKRIHFKVFEFPICDPTAFRHDVPVKDQVESGLRLIAPWLDVRVLDDFRREDSAGFAQEMLCEVMDAYLNLLSRELVAKATNPSLPDWGVPYYGGTARLQPYTVPKRPKTDTDPAIVGIDFARKGDLAAYTAWSSTTEGLRQRWLEVLRGESTPTQNEYLRCIDAELRPSDILIDMTGEGAGLYDYAKEDHAKGRIKARIHGIHFSQGIHLGGGKTTPVKKAMALSLHRVLAEGASLLGTTRHSELQRRHLLAVRRSDLDAPRNEEGHADILWANALAIWGTQILDLRVPDAKEEALDLTGFLSAGRRGFE